MPNWLIEGLVDSAKLNSDRLSVISRGQNLSYQEILNAVCSLADELKELGIQKGDVCVVLCDRNIYTIVAVFAIWVVGGTYLPISLETPLNRNDYAIQNSKAKVIIDVTINCSCKMSFSNEYSSLILRPSFSKYNGDSLSYPSVDIIGSDAAYTIFTSGTTGQPKGAKMSFSNLLNLCNGLKKGIYSHFPEHLNVALMAPFTFDASIQQIVLPILEGHTLHITQEDQRRNPDKLYRFLSESKINIFDCTPTHIKMLNSVLSNASIFRNTLMGIIIGGELLKADTVSTFARKFIDAPPQIINIYGVTECTVDSVFNFLNLKDVDYEGVIPIGIPMEGITIKISDDKGVILEDGMQGELHIGGLGVGLGYFDEKLNAGKFVELDNCDGIFYKTGDLAYVDSNGQLVCLGRKDRQIKVRGNRVELPDIEACITRYNDFTEESHFCNCCIMESNAVEIDSDGICDVCHLFAQNSNAIDDVFGNIQDLQTILPKRNDGSYDCVLLYSGGKDSTYVMLRLREMGYKILAYTFDNGYLSEQALDNIKQIKQKLNIDSVIEKYPHMDDVFKESLRGYSTVCDGCFKVLMTLSTKYAIKNGIHAIVSGLNRGQIIETKLKPLWEHGIAFNVNAYLTEQRKAYHYWDSHFNKLIELPGSPDEIDRINFIDFFFYDDTTDEDILHRIEETGCWKMSSDTGLCSTNCKINDAGIAAFIRDKGYHNYAAPLSWDIRLNRISRADGLTKIATDGLDYIEIEEYLRHFEFPAKIKVEDCYVTLLAERLVAFIQSSKEIDLENLKSFIKEELPYYMVPQKFVIMRKFPLMESGKVDYSSLLLMVEQESQKEVVRHNNAPYVEEIARLWSSLLGHSDFGDDDSFFDIGGDSLEAIMMISEVGEKFNCIITFDGILERLTINGIANQIKKRGELI